MKYAYLIFGALFGFLLSRAGATTYDFYAQLFLFEDLQLFWVIAVAALVGFVGVRIVRRFGPKKALLTKDPISYEAKPMTRTLIPGSLLLGAGWGLAGACPGTALVMLGEGKLAALFTIAGILLGTWLYGAQASRAATSSTSMRSSTNAVS